MNKKQFETSKKPFTLIVSLETATGKILYSFFDGWDNDSMKKDFEKDFPGHFHFMRLNRTAVKMRAKEMFNYDIKDAEEIQSEEVKD